MLLAAVDGVGRDDAQLFHQVFRFLHVDEAARDDIRPGDDAAVLGRDVHDHDEHTVLRQMLPVAQNDASDVADAGAVDQNPAGRNGAAPLAGGLCKLKHLADIGDKNILGIHAHSLGQTRMCLQMALLAVDWNKESGLEQSVDDLQFLLACHR